MLGRATASPISYTRQGNIYYFKLDVPEAMEEYTYWIFPPVWRPIQGSEVTYTHYNKIDEFRVIVRWCEGKFIDSIPVFEGYYWEDINLNDFVLEPETSKVVGLMPVYGLLLKGDK